MPFLSPAPRLLPPLRGLGRRARAGRHRGASRSDTEFGAVNAVAGVEPVRPEFSGLALRRPSGGPGRNFRLDVPPVYRWQPSDDFYQRQQELRQVNQVMRRQRVSTLPPIYFFPDDVAVSPVRLQLPLQLGSTTKQRDLLPLDLDELADEKHQSQPRLIQPEIPETDPEYFADYRPLLPRHYRDFLRRSPFPRLGGALMALLIATSSVLWVVQGRQAEALAAQQLHRTQRAFRRELTTAARVFALSPRTLAAIRSRSRVVDHAGGPLDALLAQSRAHLYAAQARRYAVLTRHLQTMEREAVARWRGHESAAYAALVSANAAARYAGLSVIAGPAPRCSTPRCLIGFVARQRARTAWLRETVTTIGVYRAAILGSPDPASFAASWLQEAQNIRSLLPDGEARKAESAPPIPAPLDHLAARLASATSPAQYGAVGALAHLDTDALQSALERFLPPRVIVISVEQQQLACYQAGKAVIQTPITAQDGTPTGRLTVQDKQANIAALFWNSAFSVGRAGRRYLSGHIPDRVMLGPTVSLQGAPWRTVFGPGSESTVPQYAPWTPGAIDLPPAPARTIYDWVTAGTQVWIY